MEVTAGNRFHVVVNAHLLSGQAWYRSAGVHQYIHHLLRHLGRADGRLRYTLLLGRGVLSPAANLASLQSRWPTSRAMVRVLWEQLVQPWELCRIGADLVHGPVFVGPLLAPCPMVVTIHDLSFIRFPGLFRPANRLYLTVLTRLSARRARRLIAVSAHAAAETARLLDVPPERVGRLLSRKWAGAAVLVTLGADGMCLIEKGRRARHIPTRKREVYDVAGAGDTVAAVMALGLANGAPLAEAAAVANAAAGVVVGKVGTGAVTRAELLRALEVG